MKFHEGSAKESSHKTLISGVNMETFFIRKHMVLRLKKEMEFDSQEQSNEIITTGGQSLQQGLQTTKPSLGRFTSKCYCYLLELENFAGERVFFDGNLGEISMGSVHLLQEIKHLLGGNEKQKRKGKAAEKCVCWEADGVPPCC